MFNVILKSVVVGGFFALCAVCAAKAPELPLQYERFTLDNGLTVIVNEDHSAPLVTVHVAYKVGSRNEPEGRSGFAHLFEHLMFNGSENHEGEWFATIRALGGTQYNGSTSQDLTNYYQTVPTPAVDRVLWMESDRMGHLLGAVTQAKLDEQRGVVQNEKRQYENMPMGRVSDWLSAALFPVGHPYHHSTIGSMEDLNAAPLEGVHQWFKEYYGPNNAILVLSGDIDAAAARQKVERYFGAIPPGPPVDSWKQWLPTRTHNTHDVRHDNVSTININRAWAVPGASNHDTALLALAAAVLAGSRNAWLSTELMDKHQAVTYIGSYVNPQDLASVFTLMAELKPGTDPAVVNEAMDRLVGQFMQRGPSSAELKEAVAMVTFTTLSLLDVGSRRAQALAMGELQAGDPAFLNRYLAWIDAAKPEEVREAARRHLSAGWHQLDVVPPPALKAGSTDIDRKSGMPAVSDVPVPLNFPKAHTATLSNGLKVVLAERRNAAVTRLALQFDAGHSSDAPDRLGCASLTLNLLDKGTHKRDRRAIASEAARLGANISLGYGMDSSQVYLDALPTHLPESIALWADVVRNANFPVDVFEQSRAERLAALQAEQVDVARAASRIVRQAIFGKGHGHSVTRMGLGDEAAIRALTREDVIAFKTNWLRPDNATLFVVGNITLEEVRPMLEQAFGSWRAPDTALPMKNAAPVKRLAAPRLILVDRPGAPQSQIMGGDLAPSVQAGNELAIQVMNSVLGDGFISRINLNLREDKHWSYGAGSGLVDTRGQRLFYVSAPVQTDKTAESLLELIRELKDLDTQRPITEAERAAAVAFATRELPGRFESTGSVLGSLLTSTVYERPLNDPETLAQRYRALTVQDLQAAAREVVSSQSMVWVVIGDRAKIETQIAALGIAPLEHWSADGRRLD